MEREIENIHQDVYNNIKQLMDQARNRVSREVNTILVQTYWEIGRLIVENEQGNIERAEYGKKLIADLSKRLTKEYGKGFSKSNLFNMRNFYLTFPIFQMLSGKLSWSHYCELLSISDEKKRSFYEKETIQANWSVKELKRQIKTSLFERLLLSSGDENKEKVLDLALKGNEINKASDIVKDPYVFEFLGLPEEKPIMESDLEKALVTHIEKFLLELGKGFMYVGSQQRVTLGNTHYYVDMVFYNLNYYKTEVNDEIDNEPIGIILCANKDSIQAEYALGSLSNQIFASKYTLYIPDREQLEEQVERVVKKYKKIRIRYIIYLQIMIMLMLYYIK